MGDFTTGGVGRYYRVSMIFNGQRWRIMDTLSLDEAIERVVGGPRWRGLVQGAVITDDRGQLIDPRTYRSRARYTRRPSDKAVVEEVAA